MRSPRSTSATPACLAAALLAATTAPPALADQVHGTRSELLREASHFIDIRIDRGTAKLVVRRTLWNGGARHDQAVAWIDVPGRAVATGLRTLGVKGGEPFWFSGDLLEAEAAAARYRELTGIGGYYPKDPALLSWRSQGVLALQVFPVPPGQQKTVEYTLEMPATYREGRFHVALPRTGTEALPATAAVSAARAGDAVFLGGKPVAPGTTVRLDQDEVDLAIAPRAPAPLEGGLASILLSTAQPGPGPAAAPSAGDPPARALVHLHLEAAPRISEVPRGANVVVVLDASRSMSEREAAAEVAAARAYLSHFDGARAEVLTFDRAVRGIHGRLVPAQRALATLGRLTLKRGNGSGVDAAIARADALLAELPPGAPRRIVVLTDLRTRASLSIDGVRRGLRSGALVHVGAIAAGAPRLDRDDDAPWAAVARGTGGVLWRGAASADASDRAAMARVYEELARPLRLDHAALTAEGVDASELSPMPETLAEGQGYEHLGVHDALATRVELSGELWSLPFRKALTPDDGEKRRWSALVFGSSAFTELREEEMMDLAVRGRAVSPVTSYLAIEPGVRPSTEGIDWSGTGQGFGSGHGRLAGGRRTRPPAIRMLNPDAFLHDALATAWQACGGGGRAATVTLETTLAEVVDVPSVRVDGKEDPALGGCLAEAAWELELPGGFDRDWSSWTVSL